MKAKAEKILESCVNLKISQKKLSKELGFDSSKETFIKGD